MWLTPPPIDICFPYFSKSPLCKDPCARVKLKIMLTPISFVPPWMCMTSFVLHTPSASAVEKSAHGVSYSPCTPDSPHSHTHSHHTHHHSSLSLTSFHEGTDRFGCGGSGNLVPSVTPTPSTPSAALPRLFPPSSKLIASCPHLLFHAHRRVHGLAPRPPTFPPMSGGQLTCLPPSPLPSPGWRGKDDGVLYRSTEGVGGIFRPDACAA